MIFENLAVSGRLSAVSQGRTSQPYANLGCNGMRWDTQGRGRGSGHLIIWPSGQRKTKPSETHAKLGSPGMNWDGMGGGGDRVIR